MKTLNKFRKFIKNLLNPTDLYGSLRPLVLMLFISGIPPYELCRSANENRSKRVTWGRIIGVLYLAIFISTFAMTIGNLTIVTSFILALGLSQFVDIVLMTSSLFAMVLVYLSSFVKKYHFGDVVKILAMVDTRLINVGVNLNHKKTVLTFMKYIALTAVVYGLYILGSYFLLNDCLGSHPNRFSYFAPHYIIAQTLVKYLTTSQIIRHRFTSLNKVSSRYSKTLNTYSICIHKTAVLSSFSL